MASEHDKAVLSAIFNPNNPFAEVPGLHQERTLTDDGMFKILLLVDHLWLQLKIIK